jgi:hypothetical protein
MKATMKNLAIIIVAILFITNIGATQNAEEEKSLAKPVETTENYKVYGSEFPDEVQFFAPGYLGPVNTIYMSLRRRPCCVQTRRREYAVACHSCDWERRMAQQGAGPSGCGPNGLMLRSDPFG